MDEYQMHCSLWSRTRIIQFIIQMTNETNDRYIKTGKYKYKCEQYQNTFQGGVLVKFIFSISP